MLTKLKSNLKSLSWILWLVIIALSWYVFANWGAGGNLGAPSSVVASVDGDEIVFKEYVKAYKSIQNYYKRLYGERYNSNIEKFLNIKESAINNLINERIISREAKMLGITASDAEIAEAIRLNPSYSDQKGNYVGDERLKQFLLNQGTDIKEFEKEMEGQVIYQKFLGVIQQSVFATTDELKKEYKDNNEKIALNYVTFTTSNYYTEAEKSITDEQAEEYYNSHKDEFRTPLKRKIDYVLFNPTVLEKDVNVSDSDIKKYYNDNIAKYTVEEQVKAQHILVGTKLEKRSDADALKIIEKVQAELKKGTKFEDVVKKFSDDKGSIPKGGDLGFFKKRGMMVDEFADAAFALKIGEISEPVKSTYGYHIIKTTDRIEGKVDALEDVKPAIVSKLKMQKARELASKNATKFKEEIKNAKDLKKVVEEKGLKIIETDYFANDPFASITGLGPNRSISDTAFSLKMKDISEIIMTSEGYVVFQLMDEKEPSIPEFSEVKEKAVAALKKSVAMELAKKDADTFRSNVNPAVFEKNAKEKKLEIKSVEKINRLGSGMIFGAGTSEFDKIFSYDKGQITEVLKDSNDNFVVCLVTEKDNIDNKVFLAQVQKQRGEMLKNKSNQLINATIQNARKELEKKNKIYLNPKFNEPEVTP